MKRRVKPRTQCDEVGVSTGDVCRNGELELRLEVNGHKGSTWLSREMWEAIGKKAGWLQ